MAGDGGREAHGTARHKGWNEGPRAFSSKLRRVARQKPPNQEWAQAKAPYSYGRGRGRFGRWRNRGRNRKRPASDPALATLESCPARAASRCLLVMWGAAVANWFFLRPTRLAPLCEALPRSKGEMLCE
ncbi:hypothetical protein ERJ75_000990800 [Trypanosoma vivax]|nr:hypothetical protein ERJ75_000990800 [Trypanosoma vivax]